MVVSKKVTRNELVLVKLMKLKMEVEGKIGGRKLEVNGVGKTVQRERNQHTRNRKVGKKGGEDKKGQMAANNFTQKLNRRGTPEEVLVLQE